MKKYVLTLCIALVSMCAFAQEGQKAVGFNLSYGTEISNIGIGVKGQYNFTEAIRGEASFDYFLKKDGLSMWDFNVNAHYLFPVANGFKVYPLAGLCYTHWSFDGGDFYDGLEEYVGDVDDEVSSNTGKLGVNLGGGVQYDLTSNLVLNFELKYQLISDYNQAVFGVGLAYKF